MPSARLYKFFKNKEDLYKTLMLDLADRFQAALREALEAKEDEIEKLRNCVKVKGEIFRANLSAIRLFFAEAQGAELQSRSEDLSAEMREIQKETFKHSRPFLPSGIKRKRFKRIADPYLLAVALDSITKAFLFLWLDSPEHHPYPEDPDVILNIYLPRTGGVVIDLDRYRIVSNHHQVLLEVFRCNLLKIWLNAGLVVWSGGRVHRPLPERVPTQSPNPSATRFRRWPP